MSEIRSFSIGAMSVHTEVPAGRHEEATAGLRVSALPGIRSVNNGS